MQVEYNPVAPVFDVFSQLAALMRASLRRGMLLTFLSSIIVCGVTRSAALLPAFGKLYAMRASLAYDIEMKVNTVLHRCIADEHREEPTSVISHDEVTNVFETFFDNSLASVVCGSVSLRCGDCKFAVHDVFLF
jgi:hypothetical protein